MSNNHKQIAVSQVITDFQHSCQKYFVCYSLSAWGLLEKANKMASESPGPDNKLIIVTGHPSEKHWHATININEFVKSSQANGAFPDKIAKSFITAIYSEWDEIYRHRFASEIGANTAFVKCDLMGDLRLIRHCIIHNKAIITDEYKKIRELKWELTPGDLLITKEMFSLLIDQINQMAVRVEPNKSVKFRG